MITEFRRKAMRHSKTTQSIVLTLPFEWVQRHQIYQGDELVVLSNGVLVIIPPDIYKSEKFIKRGGLPALKKKLAESI